MGIRIKILGSNSAAPAHRRHHTSQLLNIEGKYYLMDCGEGTQLQLKRFHIKAQRINHIFISHLHGDHYLGLMGLLSTMHLMGRSKKLDLYGPRGLSEIITMQLKYSETVFNYPINFVEVDTSVSKVVHEDDFVEVISIPLNHRIPCSGYLFREKKKNRRLIKDLLPPNLSIRNITKLKHGEDILNEDGEVVIKNEEITMPPKKSFSYAFCSDTKYDESIVPIIKGADMLYHESTFLEEHADRAARTFHSTAKEAATIAKKAEVGKLLLGHFSIRYKELQPLEDEAKAVFEESQLAIEGEDFVLDL
ncbi:ribonuclease Z [Roseivirga misakiensis]|uniref:Ribonuclease Z n=1 Tax=Roseivirga misakiensis TaxID=1563681 RepID=A0A1E5T1A1_9BACT|nr:ribonuclease Z [Roseivirga misakiensis]OEK05158.1 ribonuclease Z [Roseivirga misakiensis]